MAKYLITYDLHKQRRYTALYELLSLWKAVPLLESVWFAQLSGTAEEVRNFLLQTLDADDSLAVIELKPGSDWATRKVDNIATNWLSSHITPAARAA